MDSNFWENFFLTNFGSAFTYLNTALEVVAFAILFILLPVFAYSCQKNILRCYQELKRQNRHLQSQAQSLDDINRWLQYFNDRINKREKVSPLDKQVLQQKKRPPSPKQQRGTTVPPTPISPYKKTI